MKGFLHKVLIFSLVFHGFSITGRAQDSPLTSIASVGNLLPGQQVSIPVTVVGMKNVGSIFLTCDFDNTSINFMSAEVNPLISAGGVWNVGDNDLGNKVHRLIFGWYGSGITLPDSSWIVKYVFTYISGTSTLHWFDNGPSCAYTDAKGTFLNDVPQSQFYVEGSACHAIATPGLIIGPDSVDQRASGVTYSINPLDHAINYVWSMPSGVSIISGIDSNSIVVDYLPDARSGTITVSGKNICGAGPVSSLAVAIRTDPVGIEPYPDPGKHGYDNNGFLIYPNPAQDFFFLKSSEPIEESLFLTVVSYNGKELKKITLTENNVDNEYLIKVPGLFPGVYFVLIRKGFKNVISKLIIK